MVVDDDSVVHFLTEKVLSAFNWVNKKYSAFNGKEAIQVLENYYQGLITIPDLILLDLHMPVMNGIQFMEAFNKMECMKDRGVIIIVLTASENTHEMEILYSLGIKHIIPKPISIEKLAQLLNKEFKQICL